VIDKLNQEITAVVADPVMKRRLADVGVEAMLMTPTAFGKFIAEETERWGKVVREADIRAD